MPPGSAVRCWCSVTPITTRFGFVPASRYGIRAGFEVPDEAMMALVLDGSVPVPAGMIRYPAAFGV